MDGREDEEAQIIRGYGAAVRGALADAGKAPLEPGGVQLQERLAAIDASLSRAGQKRGACQNRYHGCTGSWTKPRPPPLNGGRA